MSAAPRKGLSLLLAVSVLVVGPRCLLGLPSDERRLSLEAGEPRTDSPVWYEMHALLKDEAEDYGADVNVLFVGDSITQRFRGESLVRHSYGTGLARSGATTEAWDQHFEPLGALNLGVSGDQTRHVLYRLMNGEMPEVLDPKVVVLHIGTNNLGFGSSVHDTVQGIVSVVHLILAMRPNVHLILHKLFPRGQSDTPLWDKVKTVNVLLEEVPAKLRHLMAHEMILLDCGGVFLVDGGGDIDEQLMPDRLHPSDAGLELWAGCLLPVVQKALAGQR